MSVSNIISLWFKNSATLLIRIMQASPVLLQHILAAIGLITIILLVVCAICLIRCMSSACCGFCLSDWLTRSCRKLKTRKGTERTGNGKNKRKGKREKGEEGESVTLAPKATVQV